MPFASGLFDRLQLILFRFASSREYSDAKYSRFSFRCKARILLALRRISVLPTKSTYCEIFQNWEHN